MKEYQFITGDIKYCQKVLNQWRHQYKIEIISTYIDGLANPTIIFVLREPKT
jgi:hypothetical protein